MATLVSQTLQTMATTPGLTNYFPYTPGDDLRNVVVRVDFDSGTRVFYIPALFDSVGGNLINMRSINHTIFTELSRYQSQALVDTRNQNAMTALTGSLPVVATVPSATVPVVPIPTLTGGTQATIP